MLLAYVVELSAGITMQGTTNSLARMKISWRWILSANCRTNRSCRVPQSIGDLVRARHQHTFSAAHIDHWTHGHPAT